MISGEATIWAIISSRTQCNSLATGGLLLYDDKRPPKSQATYSENTQSEFLSPLI